MISVLIYLMLDDIFQILCQAKSLILEIFCLTMATRLYIRYGKEAKQLEQPLAMKSEKKRQLDENLSS